MDHSPAWRRELPVRAPAKHVVREVVLERHGGRRADDPASFQLRHRGNGLAGRDTDRLREQLRGERTTARGSPQAHVARGTRQSVETREHQVLESTRGVRARIRRARRQLDRHQRIASALGDHGLRVGPGGHGTDEREDLTVVERTELDELEPSLAPQRSEQTRRAGIVLDLTASGRQREQERGRLQGADGVMKKCRRRLVDPLQVVDDDRRRDPVDQQARDRTFDRLEHLRLADDRHGRRRRQLRRERGQLRVAAKRVDPDPIGADHLGLERAARQRLTARFPHDLAQVAEETSLADPRLAFDKEHSRPSSAGAPVQKAPNPQALAAPAHRDGRDRPRRRGRLDDLHRARFCRRADLPLQPLEGAGGLDPKLPLEETTAVLVLRERLLGPSQTAEQSNEHHVRLFCVRIDDDATARVTKTLLRIVFGARDQSRQDLRVQVADRLTLALAPLPVERTVGQVETLEELAAKGLGRFDELFGGRAIDAGSDAGTDEIEVELPRREARARRAPDRRASESDRRRWSAVGACSSSSAGPRADRRAPPRRSRTAGLADIRAGRSRGTPAARASSARPGAPAARRRG